MRISHCFFCDKELPWKSPRLATRGLGICDMCRWKIESLGTGIDWSPVIIISAGGCVRGVQYGYRQFFVAIHKEEPPKPEPAQKGLFDV